MAFGVPVAELLWLALSILSAGIVTGLLAGLFGIGGGAIIVPVLFEVFRLFDVPDQVRMQLCIGTSLAIIIPTTIRSYLAHRAKGAVIPEVIHLWTLPAMFGVAAGALAAALAPSGVFKIAFVIIASLIATKLLIGDPRWVIAPQLPRRSIMSAYGFLVGLASSMMGGERRLARHHGADPVREADPQCGSDFGGRRRSHNDCGHCGLCAGGSAPCIAATTVLARLRVLDRFCDDCACFQFLRAVRSPSRPYPTATWTRNRLRNFYDFLLRRDSLSACWHNNACGSPYARDERKAVPEELKQKAPGSLP